MSTEKIRYLTSEIGAKGQPRFYWKPPPKLKAAGFGLLVLSRDPAEAAEQARKRNAEVDAWRAETGGADRPTSRTPSGSTREMIVYFEHSRFWPKAATSQRDYRMHLRRIDDWIGDLPARAIDRVTVETHYSALLKLGKHATANAMMRVLSALYSAGIAGGYADANPAAKMRRVGCKRQAEPIIWTDQHVEAMVETCDAHGRASIGTAMLLNYWLGQRVGDVVKLTRQCYRDGSIWVRQSKTGARIELPIDVIAHLGERLDEERERVDRLLAGKEARRARRNRAAYVARVVARIDQGGGADLGPIIVSEDTGRAYTRDNFTHVFAQMRDFAAKEHPDVPQLAELQFKHLRHTAVTVMAQAGAELPQIAAVTGHTLKSVATIIERYLVQTGQMAREGFERRLKAAEDARGGKGRRVGVRSADG